MAKARQKHPKNVRFTIDFSVEQHRCLKLLATENGMTMKEYVMFALMRDLSEKRKKGNIDPKRFKNLLNQTFDEYDEMFKNLADK